MGKINLRSIKNALKKHSPEILTGLGIAGMITTTVFAVKATPKAVILLEEKKKELQKDKLTVTETVKTSWLCYIPSAVLGSLSVLCLILANSVNARQKAAIATAYAISESALKDYQEKVIETIGAKKEQAVRDRIAKDKIDKNPVVKNEIIITEKGNTLCYDATSGRYFKSDIDKLKKAENLLNQQLLSDMYISLNDFYYELGLNNTSIGDEIGWNLDDGLIELRFSSQLAEDDTPCLVIDYNVAPKYDFKFR